MQTKFEELLGKTLVKIDINDDKDKIRFFTEDQKEYLMYHSQDCCESVSIEDICGDIEDLLHSPITQAEESSNSDELPEAKTKPLDEFTWTFYRIATAKGLVVLRWLGESNGYYSESVDFKEVTKCPTQLV